MKFSLILPFISTPSTTILLLLLPPLLLLPSVQVGSWHSHMTQAATFISGLPSSPLLEQVSRCAYTSAHIPFPGYPAASRRLTLHSLTTVNAPRPFGGKPLCFSAHLPLLGLKERTVLQQHQNLCSTTSNWLHSWLQGSSCALSSRADRFRASAEDNCSSSGSRNSSDSSSSTIKLYTSSERVRVLRDSNACHVRNFSIVAHVDHGKSSVSNAILQRLGLVDPKRDRRFLDSLEVESSRGITVRARTCSLLYGLGSDDPYVLNLIDTPGHADFSFEVKRSLWASDGAVLLVDATQGPQAQTFSHLQKALDRNLPLVAAINKIDLAESHEQVAELKKTVGGILGAPPESVLGVSAKTGEGIDELLEAIVQRLPPPAVKDSSRTPLKALVFDSFYDAAKGVVLVAVIREGRIRAGDAVTAIRSKRHLQIREVGFMLPERYKTDCLVAGQVGYICSNLRGASDIHVGDTLCLSQSPTLPLPGFEPPKRLVYAGVYPEDPSEYEKLKVSLQRLMLTDAAVEAQPASSQALGPGFRCGFLGTLHMEVVHQRLEAEFGQRTVLTSPGVTFFLEMPDGRRLPVGRPAELPKGCRELLEPMANLTVVAPMECMAAIDRLAFSRRGERLECRILQQQQQQQVMPKRCHAAVVHLVYKLPLAEILVDFADKLQSVTSGAATFDVEDAGYELSRVESVGFLVNGEPVDVMGLLVHHSKAKEVAVRLTEELGKAIPPQQFEVAVQGTVGGRIVARSTVRALRKDVTAKCYGGDVTRKLKLLSKQKAGKKRMRAIGNVSIPPKAFLGLLKLKD